MATKKNEGGASIRFDDFVKLVRPDPNKTEPVSLLNGYVGASTSDDKIRLYADSSLAEYIDIAIADILHSIPNNEDPLGGSQLWVKQSANVNHNAGTDFAQGDMYNDYMGNMYSPGDTAAMGAAGPGISAVCTIGPTILTRNVICRRTRFICPTPVSRLVICTITRPTINCPVFTVRGCPQPSLVDGCPSALGCTIQTGTTVINPGNPVTRQFGADDTAYAANYSDGDMYNDYMQNAYEPESFGGGAGAAGTTFGPATIIHTSPVICNPIRTFNPACRKSFLVICPPRTCFLGTRYPTRITLAGCPTDFCATDFTRVTRTVTTITRATDFTRGLNPFDSDYGAGAAEDYSGADYGTADYGTADYGTGDMYDSYMQNDYSGEMGDMAGQPLDTSGVTNHCPPPTQVCAIPPITRFPQQCGGITQPWITRCQVTRPWNTRCRPTIPFATRCCNIRPTLPITRCCPTQVCPTHVMVTRCQVTQATRCF